MLLMRGHIVGLRFRWGALAATLFLAAIGCENISIKLGEHERLSRIGGDLVKGTIPEDLVLHDPSVVALSARISEHGTTEIFPVSGDLPSPLGDGSGTHHIIIRNQSTYSLVIRLRYETANDKYEAIGYIVPQRLIYRLGQWTIER